MVESGKSTVTESDILNIYGNVLVGEPPRQMPLSQALQLEDILCPADRSERTDENTRVNYLAKMIGRESLLEEHVYLLDNQE